MRYVYPVALKLDEDGLYIASARDVPEALTDGVVAALAALDRDLIIEDRGKPAAAVRDKLHSLGIEEADIQYAIDNARSESG